jgi:hypothetical protein
MAGSDNYRRTERDQRDWPQETAAETNFIQLAIAYTGKQVTLYRNGEIYAQYSMSNPPQDFGAEAAVLFGRRHLDAGDPERSFVGRIKDARIYDRALDRETIAALQPGRTAPDLKPWAWWSARLIDVWASGVALQLGWLIWCVVRAGRLVRAAAPVDDLRILRIQAELQGQFFVSRQVLLLKSATICTPLAVGVRRPRDDLYRALSIRADADRQRVWRTQHLGPRNRTGSDMLYCARMHLRPHAVAQVE